MEGQPADEECKNDRENDSTRSLFPGPLQTPCPDTYGHIRAKYYQEWDEEAHDKAKNSETPYYFRSYGCRVTTLDLPIIVHNLTKNGVRGAAHHSSHPDDTRYELDFADSALVLCPHHPPGCQAAIQTYGCQKKDTGKHVDYNHKASELAYDSSKRPLVILRDRNDGENQEGRKEEVSQGQVEKPNGVNGSLHPAACHVDDQTVAQNTNNEYHAVDDQAGRTHNSENLFHPS